MNSLKRQALDYITGAIDDGVLAPDIQYLLEQISEQVDAIDSKLAKFGLDNRPLFIDHKFALADLVVMSDRLETIKEIFS